MSTEYDHDLEEFSLRLSLAGIRLSEQLLRAALLEFSDMKMHVARVNEAAAQFVPLDTPEARSDVEGAP